MTFSAITVAVAVLVGGLTLGVVVYRRFGGTRAASRRPEYLERYAEHVMAACAGAGEAEPAIAAIAEKYRNESTRSQISWGELFTVEANLLGRQPEVAIRRRAWSLRDKFREIVGTRQYDNYLLSNPPNENDPDADIPLLRADLERLLAALHWSYALIPVRERLRAQIITFVSAQIAVWTFVAAGLLLWAAVYGQALLATVLLVMLGGALGGFVSLLRRIQMVPTGGDPLLNIFELENGRVSLYLAPLSGALFALVLFFIFMGDLVQGSLFPQLGNLRLHLREFQWDGQNVTHPEYAKLLVWAFVAGFAERLVPDTLARLTERGEEASAASRTAPPAGQATGGAVRGPAVTKKASTLATENNGEAQSYAGSSSPSADLIDALLDVTSGERVGLIGEPESARRQQLAAAVGPKNVVVVEIANLEAAAPLDALLLEKMPDAPGLRQAAATIFQALTSGGRLVVAGTTSAALFDAAAQTQADQSEVGPALVHEAMTAAGLLGQEPAERLASTDPVRWIAAFVKPSAAEADDE